MSKAFLIVLLILVVLFLLMYPFIGAMIKDRRELAEKTIEELFPFFFQTLSDKLFEGKGRIYQFPNDVRCANMISSDDSRKNMIIHLMYSTGNIIMELRYKYFHQEMVLSHTVYNLRNSSSFTQKDLANEFVEIAMVKIKKHQDEVTKLLNQDQIVNHGTTSNNSNASTMNDPLSLIENSYNLSVEQKECVICIGYLIATASGESESAFTNHPSARHQLRFFNVSWENCKNRLKKDGENSILALLHGISESDIALLEPFFSSMVISYQTNVPHQDKAEKLFQCMNTIGFSQSQYEKIMEKNRLIMQMFS